MKQQFGLAVPSAFAVVSLHNTRFLNPACWPRLTLIMQALASACVAWSGLRQLVPEVRSTAPPTLFFCRMDAFWPCACPDHRMSSPPSRAQVWIDTVGWPMAYPVAAAAGARIAAYVHYPVVSTDMLARVSARAPTFNNPASVAASPVKSWLKLTYYRAFALLYGWLGSLPAVVMVNSTWTHGHITQLWWRRPPASPARIVYPPCDVEALAAAPLERTRAPPLLCSIAQFRPEKDHRCAFLCRTALPVLQSLLHALIRTCTHADCK